MAEDFAEDYDPYAEPAEPADDAALDADDLLATTQLELDEPDELDLDPFRPDLIVEEPPLPPFGKSWEFDFSTGKFIKVPNRGPLRTQGIQTLRGWIEKCLFTAREAHPIYSEDYGMDDPFEWTGQQFTDELVGELERKVTEALTQHPRILDVKDFLADFDPTDEEMFVRFRCVIDGDEDVIIDDLAVPLG